MQPLRWRAVVVSGTKARAFLPLHSTVTVRPTELQPFRTSTIPQG